MLTVVTGGWYMYSQKQGSISSGSASFVVDKSKCTLQASGAYICTKESVAPFSDIAITDTASQRTCVLSYGPEGLSFTVDGATSVAASGDLAVALYPDDSLATLARSGGNTISLNVDPTGRPTFALLVRSNFTREQCLSIPQ